MFARLIELRVNVEKESGLELMPVKVYDELISMNSAQAFEKQVEMYRQMTGEERLAIALRLHELSCNIAREGIRQQHPDARILRWNNCFREGCGWHTGGDTTGTTCRLLAPL